MTNLLKVKIKKRYSILSNILKVFFITVFCFSSGLLFAGCSRAAIGYHVKQLPNKIVYQVGEQPNFDGLKIETINTDGTYSKFRFNAEHISSVDTSTPGTKKVIVQKGNMSLSFNIYVANIVVNDSDNLKDILTSSKDGDIVYLRAGNYVPQTNEDESYKDIIINKSLTIVGDGVNKTLFAGNFIVGANSNNGVFTKIENFENVTFYGIGFELKYQIKNNFISYSGPYGKTDINGAIRFFDTKNLNIANCSFIGYGFGVLGDSADGLSITNCTFKNIQKNAIKTTSETKNSTIFKNIFVDISKNLIAFDNNQQSDVGALILNFAEKGQKGVLICKNVFTRIALHDGDIVYFDDTSKAEADATKNNIFVNSYVNNSSVVSLLSSGADDLEVTGIILSNNNYAQTLQNINMGAKGTNTVNQNGVITLD